MAGIDIHEYQRADEPNLSRQEGKSKGHSSLDLRGLLHWSDRERRRKRGLTELLGYNYVNVKWDIVTGNQYDWRAIHLPDKAKGDWAGGISQAGCYSDIQNQLIVWNAPFECAFAARSLLGWPQLILTVTAPDIFGRTTVVAYGNVHLPTQPGS